MSGAGGTKPAAARATPAERALVVCVADLSSWHRQGIPGDRVALRRSFQAAALSAVLGPAAAGIGIVRHCGDCGGDDHGRPSLAGPGVPAWQCSASSTGELAVLALGPDPLGIDLERPSPSTPDELRRWDRAVGGSLGPVIEALGPGADPLEAWTLFEALGKGIGDGIASTPPEMAAAVATWWRRRLSLGGTIGWVVAAAPPRRVELVEVAPPSPRSSFSEQDGE